MTPSSPYQAKLTFDSSHTRALAAVPNGKKVLDIGCAGGYMAGALKEKGCRVTGIDQGTVSPALGLEAYHQADLSTQPLPVNVGDYDVVLMLDIIEHLSDPESFVERTAQSLEGNTGVELIATTGNVAFIAIRLMLLFGKFDYAARGILDRTHTRLFTFSSFQKLFGEAGFEIVEAHGVPAPFPLVVGDNIFGRLLIALNRVMIAVSRGLFSYQIFLRLRTK